MNFDPVGFLVTVASSFIVAMIFFDMTESNNEQKEESHYVQEYITLKDGTECVVITHSVDGKRDVSCDYQRSGQ